LAVKLVREGLKVAASARRESELESLARETGQVESVLPLPCDVTSSESVRSAYARLKSAWGVPDVVIANAGTYQNVKPDELRLADIQATVDLNLMGAVATLLCALPDFLARERGVLVGVASLAGYRGLPRSAAYGASKAGLIHFLESLRFDVEPRGVRVVIVNPGFVKTPLTDRNAFPMPFRIGAEQSAEYIHRGLVNGRREIHYPPVFSWLMKAMRVLPYGLYTRVVRGLLHG
jgi:short-subunit dehydrogenase